MNRIYLLLWLFVLAQAGVLEYMAVRRSKNGDTFSELIWGIIQAHPIFLFVMAGVLAWLVVHFLSGGKWA